MRGNWRRAFTDGIQGYYPDVQEKTPLDYIVLSRDHKFSDMVLEMTQSSKIKVVFNVDQAKFLIQSEYKSAREALDGTFVKADTSLKVKPRSG